jgi:NADP-dependent 3-hydroxy acid dehydrogenase YdfG/acyl carrier protein
LGAAVALAEGDSWLFTGRISLQQQPWFADHMVRGMVIVPGTTFVELALRAGAEVECELLQDLVFETPLVLSEQGAAQLQLTLGAPDESGQREVAIFSLPEDVASTEDERAWTRHARGVLAPVPQSSPGGPSPLEAQMRMLGEGVWPPAGTEAIAVDDLYDYFAGVGLDYGPSFLGVRAAWRRGDEAFTEVQLPESQRASTRQFGIHPALLDCGLQTGGVLMRTENEATPEHAVLPFAWSEVRLHAPGASSLRVRLARLEAGGMSVAVADEQGRPVLSAESVVVRGIGPEQLSNLRGSPNRSLHRLEWVAITPSDSSTTPVGSLAVLGESASACLDTLDSDSGASGDEFSPVAYKDLSALLEAIEQGERPPDATLLAVGTGVPAQRTETSATVTHQVLESALSLVQGWLADERLATSRLVLLTRGAVPARSDEGAEDLAGASVWGLLRSAQSENPGRFVLIDLDEANVPLAALREVLATDEPQIALRGDEVLAARLRLVVEDPKPTPATSEGATSESGQPQAAVAETSRSATGLGLSTSGKPGTVLITGGTGALGALLARHLVQAQGVRSLLLASRQGEHASGAQRLKADLVELGARVKIAACDVSDRAQLAGLIDSVPEEYPLSAVVHAAGALDDGVIGSMTPERLNHVFAPKADAAWYLHELTEKLELSAFILFSSSTGTFGGPGQSNYAAANAFLDSLAAYRRKRDLPGISLAWGLWAETGGMASELSTADRMRMERSGMLALSAEEGLGLFDAAYVLKEPSVMPARLDMAGLRKQARAGGVPPMLRGLIRMPSHHQETQGGSLARRLASTPEGERERVILDLVRSEVASVLGHDSPDAVDVHRAFNELGFDSLTAVELRNRMSAVSGVQLPATLAFDYPSSAALSDFLLSQILPQVTEGANESLGEVDIRNAIASIPLARLRDAGMMDTLLELAGLASEPAAPIDAEDAESDGSIDEMDLESLVELTLGADEPVAEPVEGG